jgi:hypothetical protein
MLAKAMAQAALTATRHRHCALIVGTALPTIANITKV